MSDLDRQLLELCSCVYPARAQLRNNNIQADLSAQCHWLGVISDLDMAIYSGSTETLSPPGLPNNLAAYLYTVQSSGVGE